jgi:hypothetical protein
MPEGTHAPPPRLVLRRGGTLGLWLASLAGILLYVISDHQSWGLFLRVIFDNRD